MKIKDRITGLTLTFDTIPTQQEARARFDAEAAGKKTEFTGSEVAFPRVMEQKERGASYLKQTGAAGLDLLSMVGRGISALPEKRIAGATKEKTYYGPGASWTKPAASPEERERARLAAREEMATIEGETLGEDILKDPATMAAALAAIPTGGMSFAPRVAAEVGAGVGAHQLESLLKTGKPKPREAAIEAGTTMLLGGVPGAGLARKRAAAWMTKIVKPKVKLMDKFSAEKMLDKGISGSFQAMIKTAKKKWDQAMDSFGGIIDRNRDKHVNVGKALTDTKMKLQADISKKKHMDVRKDIFKEAEYWDDALPQTEAPMGMVPLEEAQNLKMSVGDRGDWNPQKAIREQKGAIRFNDEFYDQLDKQIDKVAPELKPLNKELSELRPIRQGLREAAHRTGNWNLIRLSDMMTFIPAMASPTGTLRKAGAAAMFLPRIASSPRAVSAMYKGAGEPLQLKIPAAAARRALSTGLTDPREAAIDRARGAGL